MVAARYPSGTIDEYNYKDTGVIPNGHRREQGYENDSSKYSKGSHTSCCMIQIAIIRQGYDHSVTDRICHAIHSEFNKQS